VTSGPETTPEIAAELARLRALEQSLRDERERIRIAGAQEVDRLQTALRESAARASQREREVQVLTGELQKREPARAPRVRRSLRPGRAETDVSGALERVLATFERERRELEERARAVAETELRQRAAAAEFQAEAERLALAGVDLEERRALSSELEQAGKRIEKLERLLGEHNETRASLKVATVELAALGKAAQQRREAEAALLATQARLTEVERKLELATASGAVAVAHTAGSEREAEERIEELLARRERELEEHAASDLAVRREQLEQSMATDLDRRRDELESGTRAELARREQLLAAATAEELVRRRQELELEAAAARGRLRAGGDEQLSRERAGLLEELQARERALALREDEVTRREIELSVVSRRIGDEERRLQERTWRTGAPERRASPALPARPSVEPTFTEGWRLLSRGREGGDASGGSW
jgi:hypothetical protein